MTSRPALAVLLTVVAVASAAARADQAASASAVWLDLRDSDRLPFSAAELRSLVGARMPVAASAESAGLSVVVAPTSEGAIDVASSFRRQRVAGGQQVPGDTARLVALAVVDVAREPVLGGAWSGGATAAAVEAHGLQARGPVRSAGGLTLLAAAGSSFMLDSGGASFEPGVGLEYSSASAWSIGAAPVRWGLGLTAAMSRTGATIDGRDFRLESWPVRLGPHLAWRFLQVSAGPVLRVYRTSGVDGGRGSIGGGYLGTRAGWRLGAGFRAVLALTCDGYLERLEFRAGPLSVLRTRFLVPWVGVGIDWGKGET